VIVNRNELADVFGVAKTTLDRWLQEGMPYMERADRSRGVEWRFDTAECIKWYADRNSSGESKAMDSVKLRERAAIAGLRELDLAQRQKVLVHVDDVTDKLEEEYAIIKSRLRAIPGRMAQPLSIIEDAAEVERLLKTEVADALEEISES
jgi:phage terminase Nu1 subunit (DNA packaging protein)